MTELRYVYGILSAADAAAVRDASLRGIEGAPVRVIAAGALAAALSDLDGAAYGSDTLNARIADLEWLSTRAEAHQAVNARLLDLAGSVIPLSFGALYLDDDRVRAMLNEDQTDRAARIEELRGRGEWLVTVVRETEVPLEDDALTALDAEITTSAPGRAFLLEKRRTSVAARSVERADGEIAAVCLERLEPVAERVYREPVARGAGDAVVLRISVLVGRDRGGALASAVSESEALVAPRGYRLRVSGPWPAYRFGALA